MPRTSALQSPGPTRAADPAGDDPVGLQSVGELYLSVPGETYPDGAQFTDTRGTFLKHVVITAFGRTNYWEKIGVESIKVMTAL